VAAARTAKVSLWFDDGTISAQKGPQALLGQAELVHKRFPQAAIVIIWGVVGPSLGEMPSNATFLTKPVMPERLVRAINEGPG
jgi:hypothetical protein